MKAERFAVGGAVLSAAAASLCCVGSVVCVALGLGAFGAAAAFAWARPYLLGAAALLLAFGFYRTYFRCNATPSCAPGEACAAKPVSRVGRVALWVATVAALAFALAPYYAGALAPRMSAKPNATGSGAPVTSALQPSVARAAFKVNGMTCAGCEAAIKLALETTPGVQSVEVSYERSEAAVEYDPTRTTPERLRGVIGGAGYPAELKW